MSYHPDKQGQFQSDQCLHLAPDEIVLSFKDSAAIVVFADMTDDDDLAVAIRKQLDAIVRMSGDMRSLSPTSSQYGV